MEIKHQNQDEENDIRYGYAMKANRMERNEAKDEVITATTTTTTKIDSRRSIEFIFVAYLRLKSVFRSNYVYNNINYLYVIHSTIKSIVSLPFLPFFLSVLCVYYLLFWFLFHEIHMHNRVMRFY